MWMILKDEGRFQSTLAGLNWMALLIRVFGKWQLYPHEGSVRHYLPDWFVK